MTTESTTPPPDPDQLALTERPELRVVRDTDPTDQLEADSGGGAPAEADTETTGELPVLDADGSPVTARAPVDVRIREGALQFLDSVPAFGRVPASFKDAVAYSQQGDWAVSDKGFKRVVHGLCTVIAFVATWPLVEGLGKAREKPIGLVLTALVLLAAVHTITALT